MNPLPQGWPYCHPPIPWAPPSPHQSWRTLLMLGPSRLSTTKVLTPSSATHLLAIINPLVDHVIAQTEKNQLVTLISPNHTTPSHRRGPLGHLLQTPGSFNPLGAKVSPCPYRQAIMNIIEKIYFSPNKNNFTGLKL